MRAPYVRMGAVGHLLASMSLRSAAVTPRMSRAPGDTVTRHSSVTSSVNMAWNSTASCVRARDR